MKSISSRVVASLFTGCALLASCNNNNKINPQRKDIIDAVFASGNLISQNEFSVTASAEGYLIESFVSEGDTVQANQKLFRLENEMQAAQVSSALVTYQYAVSRNSENSPAIQEQLLLLSQAKEQLRTDSINYLRYQNLIKSNAVAQAEYDKVWLQYKNSINNLAVQQKSMTDLQMTLGVNEVTAKNELAIQNQKNSYYWLRSTTSAVVLNVYKKRGDFVKKGETVARLGSGELLCKLLISEDDIQRVNRNMKVLVSLNTEKDNIYEASVSKIYPSFDDQQQSFIAEASFEMLPVKLKHNTQLQANILLSEKKNALVIPTNYLTTNGQIVSNGKLIPVKAGIKTMEWVEITDGLNDNTEIELPNQ